MSGGTKAKTKRMAEKKDKEVPSPEKDNTCNANAKGKEQGTEAVHSSLKVNSG